MRLDKLLSTEPGGQRFMLKDSLIISASPEIMGGTPVFTGTRVPVQTLLDYRFKSIWLRVRPLYECVDVHLGEVFS